MSQIPVLSVAHLTYTVSTQQIHGHTCSQSWAWSNVILLSRDYQRSVKLVTKYKDFIHSIASHTSAVANSLPKFDLDDRSEQNQNIHDCYG